MRRWLLRLVLGKKRYRVLWAAAMQTLDVWAEAVEDRTMYKNYDDMQALKAIRRDMGTLDRLFRSERQVSLDAFYDRTKGLEDL